MCERFGFAEKVLRLLLQRTMDMHKGGLCSVNCRELQEAIPVGRLVGVEQASLRRIRPLRGLAR
jgi:hypothetical protein